MHHDTRFSRVILSTIKQHVFRSLFLLFLLASLLGAPMTPSSGTLLPLYPSLSPPQITQDITPQIPWKFNTPTTPSLNQLAVPIDMEKDITGILIASTSNLFMLNGSNGQSLWEHPISFPFYYDTLTSLLVILMKIIALKSLLNKPFTLSYNTSTTQHNTNHTPSNHVINGKPEIPNVNAFSY